MSYEAKAFKVMIASPSDVNAERNLIREVLSEWNVINSEMREIVLLPVGWETHSSPEIGDRAQALINKQLKDCDLLIGVFWTRIGTATGKYPSGTVEEIEEHIKNGKPAMLYFSSAPVNPDSVDHSQYSELKKFRYSCESRGLCESYSDIIDFKSKLNRQIQLKLNSKPFTETSESHSRIERAAKSSFPLHLDVVHTPLSPLSIDAQKLLKTLSKSQKGHILLERPFIIIGDGYISPDERAVVIGAIDELEKHRLIEVKDIKRENFNLTVRGYEVAFGLPRNISPMNYI